MHLARVAAILAFGSLTFGLVLTVNSEGIMLRTGNRLAGWLTRVPGLRTGWDALARNTTKGSAVRMRATGFLAFVLGIWMLVVAVSHVTAARRALRLMVDACPVGRRQRLAGISAPTAPATPLTTPSGVTRLDRSHPHRGTSQSTGV